MRHTPHHRILPFRRNILNPIRNFLWPSSLFDLLTCNLIVTFIVISRLTYLEGWRQVLCDVGDYLYLIQDDRTHIVNQLKLSVVLGTLIFAGIVYIRKLLLRILLSYNGWLYESKNVSKWTIVWMFAVRILGGWKPSTFSCQSSLPRMPVPLLSSTIKKFMKSVKPVLSKEEYDQLKKEGKEFTESLGTSLQFLLNLKAWWSPNFVSDWWVKYAYLASRSPLPVNSNFAGFDNFLIRPTNKQTARAAVITHLNLLFMLKIENGELPATRIRNAIPMCMDQYRRCFRTTRIPGEEIDELVHTDLHESEYIVVNRKGLMYKLGIFDSTGKLLSPKSFQDQLEWIIEDAETRRDSATLIPSLTALERSDWAQVRKQYLTIGPNKETLGLVENAAFHIILDERCPKDLTEQGQFSIAGDCKSVWFDKSLSLIFYKNGKFCLNPEHSPGDAPVIGHIEEWSLYYELNCYDENGNCKPTTQASVAKPELLQWQVDDELRWHTIRAFNFARKNLGDLDLISTNFDDYGKGFVKKQKMSPDAYLQLAFQLAYYRETGKTPLTYESSMTRLYLHGRTETIRSATPDSVAFVKAMVHNNHTREEIISLMRKATQTHAIMHKESMTGKGCDRHLFALYIMCKAIHRESPFLKHALSLPFTLSTSQTPQGQVLERPSFTLETRDKASPGGCFGPTSDQGYGISYMLPEDTRFFFHISSKHSCNETNSTRFLESICTALRDMRELLEG